jgi:uncharacterized protein YaaQ
MAKKTFYVWATILSPSSARLLTSGLVERGYGVTSLADNGTMMWEGEASTLVALQLTSSAEARTHQEVMGHVAGVLDAISSMYHSLVVYNTNGAFTWRQSNIKLPERKPEKKPEASKKEGRTRFDEIDES